jgi:hypothetical protein
MPLGFGVVSFWSSLPLKAYVEITGCISPDVRRLPLRLLAHFVRS